MNLTTAARVKAYATGLGTSLDALIATLITGVSAQAERYMGRYVQSTARSEYFDGRRCQRRIFLRGYPVATSPALALYEDMDHAWGSGTVVGTSNYYLDTDRGVIVLEYQPTDWPRVFKATYTGGMAADQAAFTTAFPDISDAVDRQVLHLVRRRDSLDLASANAGGAAVAWPEQVGMLKEFRETLDRYRRVVRTL